LPKVSPRFLAAYSCDRLNQNPLRGLALDQRTRAVDPGPLVDPLHQILLDPVCQMVTEALQLSRLLVAHLDGLVAPGEDRGLPVRPAGDLLGEVAVEVLHELCELPGVLDPDEHVVVAREHHEAVEGHPVEALGPAEDAQDDLVELPAGPEQRPALNGAVGDFEEGSALRCVA
jgi:hypothetical protein